MELRERVKIILEHSLTLYEHKDLILKLVEAWDDEKHLSETLFKRAQRAESRIKELEIQVFDRGESYSLAQAEIATLQSLVPVLDGSCDICGCVPAVQVTLCEEHRDKAAE